MGLLDGKVAIITGAGGGIGRCYALSFAAEGAKVVVNDLGGTLDGASVGGQSMADKVVDEIKAQGGEAVANYDSVADYEGAQRIVKSALDAFGRADVLVNNAGILRDKTLIKMEEAMWDAVIAVHLKGSYLCGQAFARHVKERAESGDKGGRIVNTSSYAGLQGNYGQSNYSAAKAGIAGLTRTWALELGKLGVKVNCIAPMAKTRMTEDIAAVPDDMRPEHVAPLALFLASELSEDVNGRVFGVHGQQLLEYRMVMTDGVTKAGEALWTAKEIAERLKDISALEHETAKAAPAGAAAAAPLTPAQIIGKAFARLPEVFVPGRAKGWNAVIHFDIKDADPWTVTVKDGTCATSKGKEGEATCVVSVDAETYAAVVKGELKPEKAFMAGKIRASNLGDMMKFGSAFDMKKAKELAKQEAAAAAPAPAAAAAAPLTPAQIIGKAFARLPEVFVPGRAKGWNAVIHFDIKDADPWTVTVKDGTCATSKGKEGEATCVVSVDAETYAAVVKGELKPEKAFMAGKIRASNLGDMMKFGSAFDMKKAKELAKQEAAQTSAAPAAAPAKLTPGQVIDHAFGLLPQLFVPSRAKGWKGVIHFDIQGADPWTVAVKDGVCTTTKGKEGEPTCVVTVDAETYAAVVKGELKPEKAFMSGKIRASNLGDMMKFGAAFDMKKAKELAKQEGAKLSGSAAAPAAAAPLGPQAIVDRAFEELPSVFKASAASGWKAAIHFALSGGEDWSIHVADGAVTTQRGAPDAPTCVVKTSLETYAEVLRGEVRAEQAFMQKQITASNLGEMMKFGRAFDLVGLAKRLKAAPAAAVGTPVAAAEAASSGLNRKAIGRKYQGSEPLFVRPEHAALFARATQDENAAYQGEDAIAPPMLAVRLLKDVLFRTVGDETLGADLMNLVHGEQDMEFYRPLRPWDLCATRTKIAGIEDKSTGQLLRVEEEVYAGGELAVRVRASMFIRDPSKKKPKGEKGAEKKPAAETPTPAFKEEVVVPADGGPDYAEASLDNNPIHTDEEVAKLAGFPGMILQGLCTMAFAGKAVVGNAAGGDPARLRRLSVRFSKPVLMGDRLTTEGWPLEGADQGRERYGFRVVNQDGVEVISGGVAEVAAG